MISAAELDELEEVAIEGPGFLLRAAEVGTAVFVGLLVCPPLAILVVVVAAPLLAAAIVLGAIAAIVAVPYLLARRIREHHRTHRSSAFGHALRRLGVRAA